MRVTQIRVGRTYNTLMYTSQRFEIEADLDEDEPVDLAIAALAVDLDTMARATMRQMNIGSIQEQRGLVSLRAQATDEEGDTDDIPF